MEIYIMFFARNLWPEKCTPGMIQPQSGQNSCQGRWNTPEGYKSELDQLLNPCFWQQRAFFSTPLVLCKLSWLVRHFARQWHLFNASIPTCCDIDGGSGVWGVRWCRSVGCTEWKCCVCGVCGTAQRRVKATRISCLNRSRNRIQSAT